MKALEKIGITSDAKYSSYTLTRLIWWHTEVRLAVYKNRRILESTKLNIYITDRMGKTVADKIARQRKSVACNDVLREIRCVRRIKKRQSTKQLDVSLISSTYHFYDKLLIGSEMLVRTVCVVVLVLWIPYLAGIRSYEGDSWTHKSQEYAHKI